MKNVSTKFLAAAFFFAISLALLRAQTNEGSTDSETVVAAPPVTSTNARSNSNFVAGSSGSVHMFAGRRPEYFNQRNGNYWEGARSNQTLVNLAGFACTTFVIFALPVTLLGIAFYSQHRRHKMLHETVRTMVEKGIPVTPELLASLGGKQSFGGDPSGRQVLGNPFDQVFPQRQRSRNRHLLPGLILTGAGLALIVTLPEHSGPGGLIILIIGLAFLIVWLVERADNRNYDRNVAGRKPNNDPQPPKQ